MNNAYHTLHDTPDPQIHNDNAIASPYKHQVGAAAHPLSLYVAASVVLPAVPARNVHTARQTTAAV